MVSPEEFLEGFLKDFCPDLEREKKEGRTLFFCRGSLTGSTADINGVKAMTVYSERSGDRIHSEFLRKVQEAYGDLIISKGTHTSSGVEGVFHYTYVHVKL